VVARKRRPRALAPGYERIPGTLRHYRIIATGEEISRRQYQQRARGYVYERVTKGRARGRARRAYLSGWIEFLRTRLESFVNLSKNAILRELRRLGISPPHHGAKRRPTRAEAARQEAFMDFIGREPATTRQYYPTLAEAMDAESP
jgi:hypothetical protein